MMRKNMFTLDHDQQKKIEEWRKTHECKLRSSDHGMKDEIYVGAIGGAITYCFTPTGMGNCVEAHCACGKKINVTDYEDW